jgi:hypothetical protein
MFDDLGHIVAIPPLDLLRDRVERAERARGGAATPDDRDEVGRDPGVGEAVRTLGS